MDALISVETAQSQPEIVRLEAISVLTSHANPRAYVSLQWLQDPPSDSSLPIVSDFAPMNGSVALTADARANVLASLGQIAGTESNSVVGRAAAAVKLALGS